MITVWIAAVVLLISAAYAAIEIRRAPLRGDKRPAPGLCGARGRPRRRAAPHGPPELVGGSYDGCPFLPPEEVGGNEVALPANCEASVLEFYRFDGRAWRFVGFCGPAARKTIRE